jgi:ABC-type transport system involved in multi-copper enzyme maturation permease subunit
MLALIKREIQDHLVYFITAIVVSAVLVVVLIEEVFNYDSRNPAVGTTSLGVVLGGIVALGICGMGAAQMYLDKTRRISAFISTLAVSRSRILLARIISGILAILIVLVPLAITAIILLRLFMPPIPMCSGMIFEIFTATFLLALGCYCIGLQTGWNSSVLTPSLGGLGLTCIFVPLVVVKGFGPEILVILVLFIVASLLRTWHNFSSTSL